MSVSKDLVDIIKGSDDKGTKAYDTPATVTRVDGSTVWVHIPGGVDETPVKKTINAKQGDTVQVRVSGGSAWLNGNASAPPTDDTQANVAVEYALVAGNAAESAVKSASIASEAAADAKATADSVHGIAVQAQKDADNASEYAARALGNLSTVQSVTETLTWITQHGTMALTTDVALDPTHVYFVVDAGGDYVVGGVTYAIVTEPDVDDIGTYYELTIDESLNNYVGTHLALTSEGLWLLPASTGTNKVLIATGAGSVYTTAGTYIIDSDGTTVLASFRADGTTIGIDDGTEAYQTQDYHSLQMIDKEGNTFFWASDLRDNTGDATLTYSYVSNGTQTSYSLQPNAKNTSYTVSVSDSSGGTVTKSTTRFQFSSAPTNGAIITVTYVTNDTVAKAYTLGLRKSGSSVGALSVAEGENTIASGYASHAEGQDGAINGVPVYTTASGYSSHAEGTGSTASGVSSHAEGGYSTASGTNTHAEGNKTVASGAYSHAEGSGSVATGQAAHAEGHYTTADGEHGHAEGANTFASGQYSHAQNFATKASSASQTAIGKLNIEDNADNYALIIGNGTADNARSNALTVGWDGNVTLALDTTASPGTTDGDLYAAITALSWQSDVIV